MKDIAERFSRACEKLQVLNFHPLPGASGYFRAFSILGFSSSTIESLSICAPL